MALAASPALVALLVAAAVAAALAAARVAARVAAWRAGMRPRPITLPVSPRALEHVADHPSQRVYNPCVHDDGSVCYRLSTYNYCALPARPREMLATVRRRPDLQVCVRVAPCGRVERVTNAEDMRLVTVGGETLGIFVRNYWEGGARTMRQCMCSFSPLAVVPLRRASGRMQAIEKNWTPFALDGALFLSYSLNPHVVLRCAADGACAVECETTNAALPRAQLRGGSQWVRIGPGHFLGVCHRTDAVSRQPNRTYAHAFLLMEARPPFRIVQQSEWFRFPAHFGDARDMVQFCAGLARARGGRDVRLSYGVGDCVAREVTLPPEYVASALRMPLLEAAAGAPPRARSLQASSKCARLSTEGATSG